MTPQELWWRMGGAVQKTLDRVAAPVRRRPLAVSRIAHGNGEALRFGAGAVGRLWSGATPVETPAAPPAWRTDLVDEADRLCRNRLRFFQLDTPDSESEVDWNYEYEAGRKTPTGFAPSIDYRDYRLTGDAKVVWEPNRHQHLVILGRAYRATGRRRYAEKVVEQISSWIRQCPFGTGMNWRSPLELAIRMINWVWALALIEPAGAADSELRRRILAVAHRHLWETVRKYSCHSSANNHLVGEAAGVFIASSYFNSLKDADRWRRRSKKILSEEIRRQVLADGGHCELATGYHLFVLEFFLLAGLVARNNGDDFSPEYWEGLEQMFEWVAALAEGGDALPMFGDYDDGYVLDLGHGQGPERAGSLLAVGAALYDRSDFGSINSGFAEPVAWLLGEVGSATLSRIRSDDGSQPLQSRALSESGYYLLQAGHRGGRDRISVAFDCGALGHGALAAHGHADALSFTLRVCGVEVLIDPGTYDYFRYPQWREYFRSTRAHNTIAVDNRDQSDTHGPFLWGRRAHGRCVAWSPAPHGGTVLGEHDGYTQLSDPVTHRRSLTLDGHRRELTVTDELVGRESHDAVVYFHLGENCQAEEVGPNQYEVDHGAGTVRMHLDPRLTVTVLSGSHEPIAGWVSRTYHQKAPTTTLAGRCEWHGCVRLVTRLFIGEGKRS